ncbi:MAG: TonB-dependent receptor [Rhodoferax sp.]|uniref:TonB-dependent receptor plug domain-containing protein n=1 Tax=Rhodoferax sp. TaxID=50421 RepID=UPI00262386F5|nr:TonB-dependent receptor [Rhodoferax sp.]MDD2881728.1 TonB-dependent receptor [Rhodoferax sp.]
MTRPLIFLTLVACASTASAQTAIEVSEKDFLDEMPVVLSVSRLPQRLDETPGAVTVLDRDFIRRSGARDLADLLRLVPGFQSSASFYSGAPLASYHGTFDAFSNRMQVLVDGRSVYSPYFIGSVGPGLQTVALQDIDRIEILRGSNSAAYGARAFLGVVNIVTQPTSETLGAQGTLTVGQNGVRDAQARLGWGNDEATYRITVDQRADDGLAGSNGNNQVDRFNFRSDFFTNAGDEVQLRLGNLVIDSGKGLPGNIDNPLRNSQFDSNYLQADWRRSLSPDEDLAASWSHAQENYKDEFPYSLRRFGINDTYMVSGAGKASSDTLSLQHTFRAGQATRVVWGGEFRHETITSAALYATEADFVTDFTRLFGNVEWRARPSVVINAGAMAEKSSVTGETVSPRLMANWHLAPGHTLRAGVSKAYRPPSTYEKFANVRYVWNGLLFGVNTLASGNVVPESVVANELGYLGEFPRWGGSLDVRVYREKVNGFIRQLNATTPRDYTNDEDFAIQGWEYQLKWRPWEGAQFILNQAYTDIGAAESIYGNGTVFAAPKRSSALVYFQKFSNGLDFSLSHQDSGTATLAGAGYHSRQAFTRTDVRLGWPLRWGVHAGELAVTVQNLGSPYQDYYLGHNFQRRAFVTVRLDK